MMDITFELIKEDKIPYLTATLRGIKYDCVTEYYYSGRIVEKKLPGTLPKPISIVLFPY